MGRISSSVKGGKTAVLTLVERHSRYLVMKALPKGRCAGEVADAVLGVVNEIGADVFRALAWDQGVERPKHKRITFEAKLPVYFA